MEYGPPHTSHWPEAAFRPLAPKRPRGRSNAGSAGSAGASKSLLRESTERHFTEAERFGNPVLETYLMDHTYTDYRGPCFKCIFVAGVIGAMLGLPVGFIYRAWVTNDQAPRKAFVPNPLTAGFIAPMDSPAVAAPQPSYYWNLTNPAEFLAGAPPLIKEVGPFFFRGYEDRYNITWQTDPRRVSYDFRMFTDFVPELSCATCTLNATIYGPSFVWASIMETFKWDDTQLLLSFVPATLPSVLSGIATVLELMAGSPARFVFPALAGSNSTWALSQWAHCGVLGMPMYALQNAAIDAAFPHPPELCAWAQKNLGLPQANASITQSTAQLFLDTLKSNSNFAAEMTKSATADIAAAMGIDEHDASLLKGYVEYVALTYGKEAILAMLGAPLGPASGGPIVGRTVYEWTYGFVDPIVAALTPPQPSDAPWWAFNPLGPAAYASSERPRWRALAEQLANGSAPAAAASRFYSLTIQANDPLNSVGNVIDDMHHEVLAFPGGNATVSGRILGIWGLGDLSRFPFGLAGKDRVSWYCSSSLFGGDPSSPIGLGHSISLTWDGEEPSLRVTGIATKRYELMPQDTRACRPLLPGASMAELETSAAACIYGDYVDGVWNMTAKTGVPLLISRGHFYGADPTIAASLGPGAAVLQPSRAQHNFFVLCDIMICVPVLLQMTFQNNVGIKPSPVLFPDMYNGQPGPGGYIWLPTSWSTLVFQVPSANSPIVFALQIEALNEPRFIAGAMNVAGAGIALFSFWAMWSSKRNEQRSHAVDQIRRRSSVATSIESGVGGAADDGGAMSDDDSAPLIVS